MGRGGRDRSALLMAVPLALAAAAYWRVLRGGFVFDDATAVVMNQGLASPGGQAAGAWRAFWSGGRPVAELTFAVNRRLWGLEPVGYHAVNVVLHLVTVVLVWLLGREVLGRAGAGRWRWQALAVAGLWGVHPLLSQAVSYVTQRAEVLASLCMVGSLLLFLRAEAAARPGREQGAGEGGRGRGGWWWLAGGMVAFGVGLGSKAMAVTVPALWALLGWGVAGPEGRGGQAGWRRRAAWLAWPVGLAVGHGLGTLGGLRREGNAGFDLPGLEWWSYLLSQGKAVATYLRLVVWPAGQSVDWNVAPARSLQEPGVAGAWALVLALAAGAAWLVVEGRKGEGEDRAAMRVAGVGVLWFLVVVAPTSSVVPVRDLVVEHRAYLASWGVVLALVAGGERVAARAGWAHAGKAAGAVVAALWLVLAGALHARNAVWESALALWTDATARGEPRWDAYLAIGIERERRGDVEGALAAYRTAVERAGGRRADEARALHDAGRLLLGAGRLDEAEAALRAATERAPEVAEMAYALAFVLERQGDLAGAEAWAARTLVAEPRHAGAAQMLGMLRLRAGQVEDGVALLTQAARLAPGNPGTLDDLGTALERAGRVGEACAAWSAAFRLQPDQERRRQLAERATAAGCRPR